MVDTQTFTLVAKAAVGQRPWNMAISRDGQKLYVAAGRSHAVGVVDTNTFQTLKSIPVGKLPWARRPTDQHR